MRPIKLKNKDNKEVIVVDFNFGEYDSEGG